MSDLFSSANVAVEKVTHYHDVCTIIGGIYRDDNDDPDYDGCYAIAFGSNQFYFLFEGINHIEEIVEIACAHKMRLVSGYALCIKREHGSKTFNTWCIRDSGIKGKDEYIIAKGSCGPYFNESLNKFKKIFEK